MSEACLELRLPAELLHEDAFALMCMQLDASGYGEERDVQQGSCEQIAWFTVAADLDEQRQAIIQALLAQGIQAQDVSLRLLSDDWETAWQKNWQAQAVGKALCVRPSFCPPLPGRAVDIVLEPGLAFGTGTHPTTRLCLEAIETYCRQQPPVSMLDMGAGSGLLAIAALKLGAAQVLAVDNDPASVLACQENAGINGVSLQAELNDRPPARTFELVVANILAGPLLAMAESLAACVEDTLILSGLLACQQTAICAAYEAHGLQCVSSACHHEFGDDWLALSFRKRR